MLGLSQGLELRRWPGRSLLMLSPQEAIQLDGQILFSLLHKVSPVAYKHLSKQKIDPILYMTEWFMCAFSRTLPWSSVLRVWDMFFCEGRGLLLQAAAWASLCGWLAAPSARGRHLGLCQEERGRSLWGGDCLEQAALTGLHGTHPRQRGLERHQDPPLLLGGMKGSTYKRPFALAAAPAQLGAELSRVVGIGHVVGGFLGKKRAWGPPEGRGGGVPPHPVPPASCCLTFSACRGENHLPGGPGAAQTHPGLLGQAQVLPGPVRDHGAAEGPQPQDHAGDLPGAGGEGPGRGRSAWGHPSSGRARLEPGQDLVLGLPLSRVALWWRGGISVAQACPLQVIELPVTERQIEREHLIQLKKWRETHGELQCKSPPRLHGAKAISEAEPPTRKALEPVPSIIVPPGPAPVPKARKSKEKNREKSSGSPANGPGAEGNGAPGAAPELLHPQVSPHHQSKESLCSRESEDTYL